MKMRKGLYLICYICVAVVAIAMTNLMAGCDSGGSPNGAAGGSGKADARIHVAQPSDTLYTWQKAMEVYDYEPERALAIVDSAVIVGNLSETWANFYRAKIYCCTMMGSRLDSVRHASPGAYLDSAQAIGERLMLTDSVRQNKTLHQNVLEVLVRTAQQKMDTTTWMQRGQQLVDFCRAEGRETVALRTEADLGMVRYMQGQTEAGLALLDSVIGLLDTQEGRFNELDAAIVAMKRKTLLLQDQQRYMDMLPLAYRIIERLDDYEQHPEAYHDSSYREPVSDNDRADYIRFYRSQAQAFLAAAYAKMGKGPELGNVYTEIGSQIRQATAREHQARYRALEQDMLRQQAEAQQKLAEGRSWLMTIVGISAGAVLVIVLLFAAFIYYQNRVIKRQNRILVREIAEAVEYKKYKRMYEEAMSAKEPPAAPHSADGEEGDVGTMTDAELFRKMNDVIIGERLFLNPKFDRQMLVDRLQVSKERIGAAIAQGSSHDRLSDYIQKLRLEHGAQLLLHRPELTVGQVASESGFSSVQFFSNCFRHHFGMSPTKFLENQARQG